MNLSLLLLDLLQSHNYFRSDLHRPVNYLYIVYCTSCMWTPTGKAFNRLMKETFHEKQIEVSIQHRVHMYTDTLTRTMLIEEVNARILLTFFPPSLPPPSPLSPSPLSLSLSLWYSGSLDPVFLCDHGHYRVQDESAQLWLSVALRESQHVPLWLHAPSL